MRLTFVMQHPSSSFFFANAAFDRQKRVCEARSHLFSTPLPSPSLPLPPKRKNNFFSSSLKKKMERDSESENKGTKRRVPFLSISFFSSCVIQL
jgi:hypothetical protein